MLVKALDENRVKVLIEDRDIDRYDLPFEKLNYDDQNSRAFIYEILEEAYDQTGINFRNCRLMIEVIPGVSRSYYVLLTRILQNGDEKIEFDKADRTESEMYIFKIDQGSKVFRFFRFLSKIPPQKSDLYFYNQHFYVALSFAPYVVEKEDFRWFIHGLEEFGERCSFRYSNEALLREWGERLLGPDAYSVLGISKS